MVNKYIVDYHPSRSQLISRIHTLKKGGGIMELKKLPKLTEVLVTSFDKLHHRCDLYIFGLCFVVQ